MLKGEYASKVLMSNCQEPKKTHHLSITTLTRNSASFIKEWLEYHLLIGVDHFYILDNESGDGLYSVLKPYIEKKTVTYIPWKDDSYRDAQLKMSLNTQQKGLVYALSLYGCKSDWIALIDDDEFILPKGNRTLKDILNDYTDYGGLALGWAWFGSNGHISKPDNNLVVETFTKRRADLDILYKTIIQPKYFRRMKTIHYPVLESGYPLVTEHFNIVSTIPEHVKKFAYKLNDPTNDFIQLNYYKVKSQEEWLERTQKDVVADGHWRKNLDDFYNNDFNEVDDNDILKFLPDLKKRLSITEA